MKELQPRGVQRRSRPGRVVDDVELSGHHYGQIDLSVRTKYLVRMRLVNNALVDRIPLRDIGPIYRATSHAVQLTDKTTK
jgi:hypothetical protein